MKWGTPMTWETTISIHINPYHDISIVFMVVLNQQKISGAEENVTSSLQAAVHHAANRTQGDLSRSHWKRDGEIYEFMGLKIPSSNVKDVVNGRKMSQICVNDGIKWLEYVGIYWGLNIHRHWHVFFAVCLVMVHVLHGTYINLVGLGARTIRQEPLLNSGTTSPLSKCVLKTGLFLSLTFPSLTIWVFIEDFRRPSFTSSRKPISLGSNYANIQWPNWDAQPSSISEFGCATENLEKRVFWLIFSSPCHLWFEAFSCE